MARTVAEAMSMRRNAFPAAETDDVDVVEKEEFMENKVFDPLSISRILKPHVPHSVKVWCS